MSRPALLRMLHQRIGLDADALGERVLHDGFAEARKALGVADDEALYGRVLLQPEAFVEIVERFVVPETWFFRAADQYADLVRHAGERRGRRPLRILSLPCASGEEAWSAVIVLLQAGWPAADIDVLGIDVSRRSIERAQAGVYRDNSLRGRPLRDGWMRPLPSGFTIPDAIRGCARFRVGNALDPDLLGPGERFDAIFCRNLLIYLHGRARAQVLATLLKALVPGGLLLAGQAEALDTLGGDLRPYEDGCPLSYIRASAPTAAARTNRAPAPRAAPAIATAAEAGLPAPAIVRTDIAATAAIELSPEALADAGRLDEARAACGSRLRTHPDDVRTLFLLGLVESARADFAAADAAFAAVCFLDRDHLDAMDHRIALAERTGRHGLAGELRQRARRLRERLGKSA